MIPYSIHVAIILAACFLFYKLLLQRETFYRLNRIVLLVCLSCACILPLISVPRQFSFKTEPKVIAIINEVPDAAVDLIITNHNTVSAETNNKAFTQAAVYEAPLTERLLTWAVWFYWFGVAAFGANLLIQIVVLLYQSYKRPAIKDGIYRIIELEGDKAPCSFGNSIFINPSKYDWETYTQILMHEKVHIQQGHSFDLIVAELMLVMQWFNPFAWLYRKELENNLEFLTDDSVLNYNAVEVADYQLSLLKVSVPNFSLSIATNYNQSLLKKRIVMMNAKKSNLHTMWKYFMLMPLFVLLVCGLNKTVAVSSPIENIEGQQFNYFPSDSVLNRSKGLWFATIKKDKITIECKSEENDENNNWSSSSTFNLADFPNLPRESRADFSLNREAGILLFNGKFDENQGYGRYKFTPNKDYVAFMKKQEISNLQDDDYFSFFMMDVKQDYVKFLKENGFDDIKKTQIMSMTALKVDADYIKYWKKLGYVNLLPTELVSLKALKVDSTYVNEIRKAGYTDLTIRQLISFKSQKIDGEYINSLQKARLNVTTTTSSLTGKPTASQIISSKRNQNADYTSNNFGLTYSRDKEEQARAFKEMTKSYYGSTQNSSYNQTMSLKSLDVSPEFIKSFEKVGFKNLSANDYLAFKSFGITPEFVKGFQDIGLSNFSARDIQSLKISKTTAEFAKGFVDNGFKDLTSTNLASLKIQGVTPQFIKEFKDLGYGDFDLKDFYSLKNQGITPEYVKSLQDLGYKDLPLTNFSSLKRYGITADFVKGFNKLGFNDISVKELTALKTAGITPEFVADMRQKGFNSTDLYKYIQLKNFDSSNAETIKPTQPKRAVNN